MLALVVHIKQHCKILYSNNWSIVTVIASNHVLIITEGCPVQVGNGIELEAVGLQFEPYLWRPCGVTWDSS